MFEPTRQLLEISKKSGLNILQEDFAKYLDDCDSLKEFKNEYQMPKNSDIPFGKLGIKFIVICMYLAVAIKRGRFWSFNGN